MVVNIGNEKVVNISNVTKTQLARQVNVQTDLIKKLQANLQLSIKALIVIVEEYDAVSREGKVLSLSHEAIGRVPNGTDIHFQEAEGQLQIYTSAPKPTLAIEIPNIVMPSRRM